MKSAFLGEQAKAVLSQWFDLPLDRIAALVLDLEAGREAQERYDGLTPIETVLTRDQIARIDAQLRPEAAT